MKLKLSHGSSNRGAQMGRPNILPTNTILPIKLRMERIRMTGHGDYDSEGAYWGIGRPLYCAYPPDLHPWRSNWDNSVITEPHQIQVFVRADSRKQAKELVKNHLSRATFFR